MWYYRHPRLPAIFADATEFLDLTVQSSRLKQCIRDRGRVRGPFSADQLRLFAGIAEEPALKTKGKV